MHKQASLDVLKQVHRFPGPYMFKVIGANNADFVAQVVQIAVWVLGPHSAPDVSIRHSEHGRHQSITLKVQAPDAEGVLDIYKGLGGLSGVRFLL